MPITLSASNSLFELAFGVNAILPALFAGFRDVKEKAADSLLRKIKELHPEFEIAERDRLDFVKYHFDSSRGLRHAKHVTNITAVLALSMCATALVALCLSAAEPNREVPPLLLFSYVGVALVGAPIVYWLRDQYLQWLYSIMVVHSTNDAQEAKIYADCVTSYLVHKKEWEPIQQGMEEFQAQVPLLLWKLRWMRLQMWQIVFWGRIRSWFAFKRKQ